MLSAPPRPSRWTGPPGQGPPTGSVPTSIASELLRGPGLHSLYVQTDGDRVERLDVASLDQGEEGPQPKSAGLAMAERVAAGATGRADPEFLGVPPRLGPRPR